jgi:PAS domain S-box-containing protein
MRRKENILNEKGFLNTLNNSIFKSKKKQVSEIDIFEGHLLHALMDNIPDSIYFKDLQSRFIRTNKAHAKYFGFEDPQELIGKTDFDFFSIEHAQPAYEDEQEVIRTGKPVYKEEKEIWPDGRISWVLTVKAPFRDEDGNIIGTLGISRNITERKQFEEELIKAKEKAEENDRLKTIFLQNISHEVRTPLNALMGFSYLIEKHIDQPEKLIKYTKIINKSSEHLLEMINGLLDISRIEAGQISLNLEKYNLNFLLDEINTYFINHKKQLKKDDIELVCKKFPRTAKSITLTDPPKLKQIFINLIQNAFKFTSSGSIEFGYMNSNEEKLSFYVKDTGPGIPKERQTIIFERFVQGNKEDDFLQGIGLGLAIVKGLIEIFKGNIWLESELNKGTVFYFSIPVIPD